MCVPFLIAAFIIHYTCAEVKISRFIPACEELYAVTSPVPRTWLEMRAQCNAEHPGYFISRMFKEIPPEVVALCPQGTLVPIAVVKVDEEYRWDNVGDLQNQPIERVDKEMLGLENVTMDGHYGALLWPTVELHMVEDDAMFTCAICGMSQRLDIVTKGVFPPHNNSIFSYDIQLVSNDCFEDVAIVGNGSKIADKLLDDLAEAFNISINDLRWHGATLNEEKKAEVHVYYDRGGKSADWFYYDRWNDEYVKRKSVDHFEMTMIKLNTECLSGKKFLPNVRKETYLTGAVDVTIGRRFLKPESCHPEFTKGCRLRTRECYWNEVEETALWSEWNTWCVEWTETFYGPTLKLSSIISLEGEEYKNALTNVDVLMAYVLETRFNSRDTMFSLQALVEHANTLIQLHVQEKPHASAFDMLSHSIPVIMSRMLMNIELIQNNKTEFGRSALANILVAEFDSTDPLIGSALALSDDIQNPQVEVVPLNHGDTTLPLDTYRIVVTVSDSITFSAKRLAIAFYGTHLDPPNQTRKYYDDSLDGWMSVIQVTFKRDDAYNISSDTDYVDIAFRPMFYTSSLRGMCAERNFSTDEWFGGNCRILRSIRDNMLVCRCTNLQKITGFTSSLYLIYGYDASLSTYLANNLTLVIVIVVVCFMSALGFLSVILTAIRFPEWRADQGHKIFLQMTLALTVNLVLGFVNNFVSIDTKSIACIGIGVLRHYSFLAMFFWMMVLSGLQVKRLTTISGSKGTTHLVLKVSAIAWGLPLIPIVILLSWDTGFYKSEVSNRGYCYPEGIAFQATVQGPAGVILIANLFIFVIILNHLYGWVKCNKDVVIRKHNEQGDRAEQLRKLGSSIFVFFLFGFTWTFHFLSEEGIINSEFLFEFLFLITASFHLFMLSLFFIVLDTSTRELWKKVLPCR